MAASFSITRVTAFWGRLTSSFWFVSAVMAVSAVALSFVLIDGNGGAKLCHGSGVMVALRAE